MPSDAILHALAAARRSLDGAGTLPVIRRRDGGDAIAFLVSLDRPGGDLVIPLQAGLDFVGTESSITVHEWRDDLGRPVEAATWFFSCEGDRAQVADARSSNGSTLERAAGPSPLPHPHWRPEFIARMHEEGWLSRGEGRLPPDMRVRAGGLLVEWREIEEGDRLRGGYATLAFGWRRGAGS